MASVTLDFDVRAGESLPEDLHDGARLAGFAPAHGFGEAVELFYNWDQAITGPTAGQSLIVDILVPAREIWWIRALRLEVKVNGAGTVDISQAKVVRRGNKIEWKRSTDAWEAALAAATMQPNLCNQVGGGVANLQSFAWFDGGDFHDRWVFPGYTVRPSFVDATGGLTYDYVRTYLDVIRYPLDVLLNGYTRAEGWSEEKRRALTDIMRSLPTRQLPATAT